MLRRVILALVALIFFAPSTASADPGFACRGTGAWIELANPAVRADEVDELSFTSVKKAAGNKVTLAGKATGRFAKRGSKVTIRRRHSCTREAVAGKAKVGKGGKFKVVAP